MDNPPVPAPRTVDRVQTKTRVGPDTQVDDRNLIIDFNSPQRTDPFLLLSEDFFSSPGFEWHPHRGLETVTLVLDGVLEHGDNTGNAGALHPGDVQWMTAGRGIIHRELALGNEYAHILQMWLNLPAKSKMVDTRYQDLLARSRPVLTAPGVRIEAVSGTVGAAGLSSLDGPALNHLPVTGGFVTLDPGSTVEYELPASHRAFAYVMSGAATVAGRRADAGQIAWSDPVPAGRGGPGSQRSTLRLAAREREHETKLMVYSGQPLNEPIVFGGPFVMNEQREIYQAFQDFHAGKFGDVPRQARLKYS